MVGNVSPVFLGIAKAVFIVVPLMLIAHFGKYHNTLCLSPQILHKHCFQFSHGTYKGPKRKQKQCLCKIWGDKQRVLWYFPKWPMAATPDGVSSKTVGFSGFISPYLNVLTTV